MTNPFESTVKNLGAAGAVRYYDINALGPQVASLPQSIKVMLEQALRQCDDFEITRRRMSRASPIGTPKMSAATSCPSNPRA